MRPVCIMLDLEDRTNNGKGKSLTPIDTDETD
jgi:hypothetical protein